MRIQGFWGSASGIRDQGFGFGARDWGLGTGIGGLGLGVGTRDWGSGIRDYVGRPYRHCPLPMIGVWVEGSGIRDQESGVRMAAPSPLHPNPHIKALILHHNIARALGIWRCKLKSDGKTQGWNNNSRNAGSGRTGMASQIFRPHRPRLVTVGVQGSATSAGA